MGDQPVAPPGLFKPLVRLSANFKAVEFACNCGCGYGLGSNDVSPRLVAGLQELRDRLGKPIHIDSGCRCVPYNLAKGGAAHSRHLLGWAADIRVDGMTARELYVVVLGIAAFSAGGVGVSDEGQFVHVDVREGDQLTHWCYRGGKEVAWYDA